MTAQRGSRWGGPLYPLYRRLVGTQDRSGRVRKISPSPGFKPRTIQPVAIPCTDYAIPSLTAAEALG